MIYIPINVIFIINGQIFLFVDLFNTIIRTTINVGIFVSRVRSTTQIKVMKQIADKSKLELTQFTKLEVFAQFAFDLDKATQNQLARVWAPHYTVIPSIVHICDCLEGGLKVEWIVHLYLERRQIILNGDNESDT